MSSPFGRIGKALIKYFKPVRVIEPHSTEQWGPKGVSEFQKPHEAQVEKKKSTPIPFAEIDNRQIADEAYEKELQVKLPPNASWLDLVLFLLAACKRISAKMKSRKGIATYRQALQNRGNNKLKTVGSIIDTDKEPDEPKVA